MDLKGALNEVRQRKGHNDQLLFGGFSEELIDDIIKNCSRLFTVSDIMDTCPVFSIRTCMDILEVVQEVFDDIPNFDECMDLLWKGELKSSNALCLEDAIKAIDFSLPENVSDSDEELPEVLNW